MMRVGVIGGGYMGLRHCAALSEISLDIEVYLAEPHCHDPAWQRNVPEAVLGALNERIVPSVAEFPPLDYVVIATAVGDHYGIMQWAVEQRNERREGYHVLCEKPLAPSGYRAQLDDLCLMVERLGMLFVVDYIESFDPFFPVIHEWMRQYDLEPTTFFASRTKDREFTGTERARAYNVRDSLDIAQQEAGHCLFTCLLIERFCNPEARFDEILSAHCLPYHHPGNKEGLNGHIDAQLLLNSKPVTLRTSFKDPVARKYRHVLFLGKNGNYSLEIELENSKRSCILTKPGGEEEHAVVEFAGIDIPVHQSMIALIRLLEEGLDSNVLMNSPYLPTLPNALHIYDVTNRLDNLGKHHDSAA